MLKNVRTVGIVSSIATAIVVFVFAVLLIVGFWTDTSDLSYLVCLILPIFVIGITTSLHLSNDEAKKNIRLTCFHLLHTLRRVLYAVLLHAACRRPQQQPRTTTGYAEGVFFHAGVDDVFDRYAGLRFPVSFNADNVACASERFPENDELHTRSVFHSDLDISAAEFSAGCGIGVGRVLRRRDCAFSLVRALSSHSDCVDIPSS